MSPRTPSTDFSSSPSPLPSTAGTEPEPGMVQDPQLQAAIVSEAQEAIFSSTLDGIITTWNHAAEHLFGYAAPEILGMPTSLFVPPAYLLEDEMLTNHISDGNVPAPFETSRRHKTGETLRLNLTLSPIKNTAGEIVGVATLARNTCEPRQMIDTLRLDRVQRLTPRMEPDDASRHLKTLPTTDSLTGLKNHRIFQEWLRREVDQAIRYDAPLSALLIDIDRFKAYNERFGHQAGDAALQRLAEVLKSTARTTELVARYGNDTFAILLPETDAGAAKAITERFRAAIEMVPWPHRPISVSCGIATFGADAESPTALIAQAEEALARSKRRGTNYITHAKDRVEGERPSAPSPQLPQLTEIQTASPATLAETLQQNLRATYDAAVESWARLLDQRDKETEGHNRRVTALMVRLAQHVGMSEEEVQFARWGAQLHDIGKMGVPDEILHKRGGLTVEEWIEVRRHPAIAFEMLAPLTFLGPAVDVAYAHHEKWDGTGYPRALRGTAIPYLARLFAVIDVYDALCSDRSYRDGWPENKVCEYLRRQAGTHFDPQAVDAFLEMLGSNQVPPKTTRYASVA